jgi:hypothetical protein
MNEQLQKPTRPCSIVFFNDYNEPKYLNFECRHLNLAYKPKQRVFKGDFRMRKEEVIEILRDLCRQEKEIIEGQEQPRKEPKPRGPRVERIDEVNDLREEISLTICNTVSVSYREVAKRVGCHTSTVKSLYLELVIRGDPKEYNYNNQHSVQTDTELNNLINDPANQFLSTADYKRRVPVCSKKYIRRCLKNNGLSYKKLERRRKVKDERKYNKGELKKVIWTAVQAMARDDETILFLDEATFPCNQTSDYCWVREREEPIYNRRESTENLYLIALCSQRGYVAFQVHSKEPNKEAIHYFLSQVLERLEEKKRVVVLLDNAGWHLSNLVISSRMSELLLFNVAYCWESNLIEITFSKMKSLWRQRRVVRTFGEEVDNLVRVVRGGWSEKNFGGYRRQYYRQLEVLLRLL